MLMQESKLIKANPYLQKLMTIGQSQYADYLNEYYFSDNYDDKQYELMLKAEADFISLVNSFVSKLTKTIYNNDTLDWIRAKNYEYYKTILAKHYPQLDATRSKLLRVDNQLKFVI